MKNISIKYLLVLTVLAFVFISCDEDDHAAPITAPTALTNGSADFSNYVAIGNSLTAGFTDGALFIAGQENAIPNLLSQKFALAGGGAFTTPFMSDNVGGFLDGGVQDENYGPRLYFNGAGPAVLVATSTTDLTNPVPGPYNNMGVPGAKSYELLKNNFAVTNPYYGRMASSGASTVIEDVMAQNPTFFTLWIGANDVLSYAINGGDGVNQLGNTDSSTYSMDDITDPTEFNSKYDEILSTLTANGTTKGVVLNIPYVTSIPHFTTVPHAPLDPTNPDFGPQIPTLNATFAQLNAAYAFLGVPERSIVFSQTAASAVVIHDETLPNIAANLSAVLQGGGLDPLTAGLLAGQYGQSRQATSNELLVLSSSSIIGKLNQAHFDNLVLAGVPPANAGQLAINGVTYPLQDKWVLLPSEQLEIKTATDAFNASIAQLAMDKDIPMINANLIMQGIDDGGLPFDEFNMASSLVFGNTFSLDGVHPTARGNAYVANLIMQTIDAKYGSNFEDSGNLLKAADYPTLYSPNL